MREHGLIERLPKLLSLIAAVRHLSETCGETCITQCRLSPLHEILPTIMILQAFQGKRRDEMGKLVQAGGFNTKVALLGTKRESFVRRELDIQVFIEVTDVRDPANCGAHTDDVPAAEQRAPHGDLIKTLALQAARGAVSPQTITDHVVRDSGEEQVVQRGED